MYKADPTAKNRHTITVIVILLLNFNTFYEGQVMNTNYKKYNRIWVQYDIKIYTVNCYKFNYKLS